MNTAVPTNPYPHPRFPAETVSHGGWLFFCFCLSYRDVEEVLFARGVIGGRGSRGAVGNADDPSTERR
jgi:transposase-like protein